MKLRVFTVLSLIAGLLLSSSLIAQERINNQKAEGYRGIWFTLGQVNTEYGDKYSGGLGTYTAKHIPMAIYSPEADKTFFVYGGTPDQDQKYLLCMAGCYDHKTGLIQRPTVVHDKGVDGVLDPHDNPTIQIDKDGYIWVFVAGRGNKRPGIRYRSTRPYDITSFDYVNESIMAYPEVFYDKDKGFFLFFTRYDGFRRTFFQTSKDGITWSGHQAIASIIEPGEKLSGHYQFANYNGKKLICAFNRHPDGKVDERTNIYYIQSEDWGKTWTDAAGEHIKLPVTREEGPALVRNFRKEGKNCYIKDINFDKDGNPVILYLTSDSHLTGPQGGAREWWTAHWNGRTWNHTYITTSTHCYDTGSLYVEGKKWYVLGPTEPGPQYWGAGGEMALWRSQNNGDVWEHDRYLTRNSQRNHSYARRPVNAHPDFFAFWADGDTDKFSISNLYFCTKDGKVFRMPYTMTEEWEKPQPLELTPDFDSHTILSKKHPRLLIDSDDAKSIRRKLKSKGTSYSSLKQMDEIIMSEAAKVMEQNKDIKNASDQETTMTHLLTLAYSYKIHGNKSVLPKLKKDLLDICKGEWGSVLKLSETAFSVSLAYDWIWDTLSEEERKTICDALIEKVIKGSESRTFRSFKGNWNSICNCAVIAACIAVCDYAPELAEEHLNRSFWSNQRCLPTFYDDGGYPEGCGYWNYGTTFQICLIELLKNIYGHDGGLSETPGFMKSAEFALYSHGTMDSTFSFADGGLDNDLILLSSWWFAAQKEDPSLAYAEKRFLENGRYKEKMPRMLPVVAIISANFDLDSKGFSPPASDFWSCNGETPLCIIRKGWDYNQNDIYLGIKGGSCNSWKTMFTAHSHMDAGSFVFEADGVRWSDDIMRPVYGPWFKALKDAGSRSGATYQSGLRWNTFSVNNLSHSCIVAYCNDGSVEGKNHPSDYYVDGSTSMIPVNEGERQGAVVDMSEPMKGQVKSATRTITVLKDGTLEVTDVIEALPQMDCPIEWRMLTKADAEADSDKITLRHKDRRRILVVKVSDKEINPEYRVLPPALPESWEGFTYCQEIKGREIASWSTTIPAGKKVTFVTTLSKQ